MMLKTVTFDPEKWQLVPKELTNEMFDCLSGANRHWSLCADWNAILAVAPEPETCFCDEKGIGDPAKSCGDCPRDYGIPTVRANPEPPMALGTQTLQEIEMTTKRIPFDLERALAGDALVTRGGLKVTDFRLADIGDTRYPYKATIHTSGYKPNVEWFAEGGRFYADNVNDSPNDLFMVENTSKPQYMVNVEGRTAPRIVHADKASAVTEAERLMNADAGDVIRVLRVEQVLRRRVITEWSEK